MDGPYSGMNIIMFYPSLNSNSCWIPAKTKDTSNKDHSSKDKQDRDNNNGDTDDEKHKDEERRFEPPSAADGDLVDMLGEWTRCLKCIEMYLHFNTLYITVPSPNRCLGMGICVLVE